MKKIIKNSFTLSLLMLFSLMTVSLVMADSNGIWTLAEDVRTGTFGGDELSSGIYGFNNIVNFQQKTYFSETLNISTNSLGIYVISTVGSGPLAIFDGGDFIIKNGDLEVEGDFSISGVIKNSNGGNVVIQLS